MKRIVTILLLLCSMIAHGQTFDYSDIKSGKFSARTASGLRSMADAEHYTAIAGGSIVCYNYVSGAAVDTLYYAAGCQEIGSSFSDYQLSTGEDMILFATNTKPIYRHSFSADYWIYDIKSHRAQRLTPRGAEQVACFSPDGTKVGFVRDNDIWYVSLKDMSQHRVTTDGKRNSIINGHTDWVYEEEFAFTRAFEFSLDSRKIAYLRFDETLVPEFTMMRFDKGLYPYPYKYKYPKAGEPNSIVELRVYDIESSASSVADVGAGDQYIPAMGWTPNNKLYAYRENRLQNHFEVLMFDNENRPTVIYSEHDDRYIERPDKKTVTFLPDGERFIVQNESCGARHLYLYSVSKGLLNPITGGDWEVTDFVGVSGDRVYYISCEGSPLRRNLYSVLLNGKHKQRMTMGEGTYSVAPSVGMRYYIATFSNVATPPIITLHSHDGKLLRTLEDNTKLKRAIEKLRVPKKEFFDFTTPMGETLNGYIIKPYDFDSTKRYPLLMSQYSGPGSQEVVDRWSISWCDVLVQKGYVVVSVDGRGTGGRGEEFRKCTYAKLGVLEVEDQVFTAHYLAQQPWVDAGRIAIYGWSYGGFMALGSILKGNDIFKMAIAVAPVTSWRFYDTIYTEIYNGLPKDNAAGYDSNPINLADSLRGKLLIVHGTADDNVHVQNSYAMADALVKAGKKFDMMIYPDNNHSMRSSGRHHVMEMMIDYTLKNL